MADLAVLPAVAPVEYGETGLVFPRELGFDEWQALGATLGRIAESVMWWLGDWYREGERRYGESAAQAAPTGYAVGTLQEAARVADRIESPRRLGILSWSHHQAVAALDVPEQDALLHRAAAEHLSVRDLRHEVQRAKMEFAGLDAGHSMQAMAAEELRALAATLATALERRAAAWVRWIAAGMPADELARMSGVEVADVLRALGERVKDG